MRGKGERGRERFPRLRASLGNDLYICLVSVVLVSLFFTLNWFCLNVASRIRMKLHISAYILYLTDVLMAV